MSDTTPDLPACLQVRDGQLWMEELSLAEAAGGLETPAYLISRAQLTANVERYQAAFSDSWPHGDFMLMPAFKACPLLAVRQILSALGCGCDVFGPGELYGALRAGVAPHLISVNGSIKDEALLRTAIAAGTRVVLDSPRELELVNAIAVELGVQVPVLFRPKPFLADLEAGSDFLPDMEIRELTQIIKYGIPASELDGLGARALKLPGVRPVGIHVHMGRHSKTEEVWRAWVRYTVRALAELAAGMDGWRPEVIDLGGGMANPPDRDTDVAVAGYEAPDIEALAAIICDELEQGLVEAGIDPHGICLEVEPGRGLHGDTSVHLTRVCNIKKESRNIQRKWLELDTSEVFLGVGSINFEPPFAYLAVERADEPATETVDMVGKTCNAEMLFLQVPAPAVACGEHIAFLNTGAYCETNAANFNALPRPGTWLVDGTGLQVIKHPESVEQVYQRDVPLH